MANRGTLTADNRRMQLRAWIDERHNGVQAAFVAATGINQGELSGLLKDKSFGEKKARALEEQAGMPDGYLDAKRGAAARLLDKLFAKSEVGPDDVRVASDEIAPGYLRLPQLDLPAGAGPGVEMDAEPDVVQWIDVAEQWAESHFQRHVARIRVMTAKGDSMVGAGILSGDLLFVDTGIARYDGDGYYIMQFLDGWQVKRLRADVLSQQVEIVSMLASGEQAKTVPSAKLRELRIGGKVSAWWTLRKH